MLQIEFIQRGDWQTLALCSSDLGIGGIVGTGLADTQQQAAIAAVNAFFRYERAIRFERENPLPTVTPSTDDDLLGVAEELGLSEDIFAADPPAFTKQIAVSPSDIEDVLHAALDTDPRPSFVMQYTDARENETTREIIPSSITGTVLVAIDVAKDEPRTFVISRIGRLEKQA